MDNDNLDFLDGETPAEASTAAPTEAPAATPTPGPTEGPARGPDGKFAPKAEAPVAEAAPQAPAIAPEAASPTPATAEPAIPPGYVPVAALQALREENRRYQQQAQTPAPDPYEDFEAYQAHQESVRVAERAEWSRQIAELKFGAETVTKAQEWAAARFEADPAFQQRALSSRDPYGFAIEEHQRDQALQLLSDPKLLEQFRAFQAGAPPAPTQPAAVVVASPQLPTPPRSIAAAANAGGAKPGAQPTGPNVAFDSVFKD